MFSACASGEITARCSQALTHAASLASLSLSHNALCDIALPRGALPLLIELNVNKNTLSSLSFLEVTRTISVFAPSIRVLLCCGDAALSTAPCC